MGSCEGVGIAASYSEPGPERLVRQGPATTDPRVEPEDDENCVLFPFRFGAGAGKEGRCLSLLPLNRR